MEQEHERDGRAYIERTCQLRFSFLYPEKYLRDFRNPRGTRLRCRCEYRPLKSHLGYYARYPCLSCQIRPSEWTEPRSRDE